MVLPYINMNQPQVYMCSPSWTLLPPPSLYHPSGSSQCTSPKHPVSCIEPGLATCFIYDIIHVSMPFSQIIPPSPSPTKSKRLFYTLLGAGALGQPRGMVQGGRREEGSGWGTRVYMRQFHVDIRQNQYNIVKLKNKIIEKEKRKKKWAFYHIKTGGKIRRKKIFFK